MNKNKSNEILNILEQIIINPKPELIFNNNFELLIAVMLSAQTTDKRVNIVTKELFYKYRTPYDLGCASIDDVSNIICSLGLVKNKAKNIIETSKILYEKYNSIVPNTFEDLTNLPGVGRKTANVVLALGFNIPAFPVDTHLYRMSKLLGYIKPNMDVIDAEESYKKYIDKDKWILAHHLFLLFARYTCTAKNPKCDGCRLKEYCSFKKD